ncbi:MAG: hypothetical protein K9N07_04530 [Candidatus Cloacimonetes bacterium]|nr:hypothetical protein [Candidatus Cloacimonadota bacterium]
MEEHTNLKFTYTFYWGNGTQRVFEINLDPESFTLQHEPYNDLPNWTDLDFNQCPNCRLKKERSQYCPVAANIIGISEFFKDFKSFENISVKIKTPEREYSKKASLQQGASSILGIIMVTSGCPILIQLKPMVRYHLPFATIDETIYRAVSMYLVKQYLKNKKGEKPDWELTGLLDMYNDIHKVNKAFYERLSFLKGFDANANALIILDNFANYINFSLDKNKLTKITKLFNEDE